MTTGGDLNIYEINLPKTGYDFWIDEVLAKLSELKGQIS